MNISLNDHSSGFSLLRLLHRPVHFWDSTSRILIPRVTHHRWVLSRLHLLVRRR